MYLWCTPHKLPTFLDVDSYQLVKHRALNSSLKAHYTVYSCYNCVHTFARERERERERERGREGVREGGREREREREREKLHRYLDMPANGSYILN